MQKMHDIVDFDCVLKHTTSKAYLVEIDSLEHWMPISKVEITDNHNGTHNIQIPSWLAEEKGLI